MIKEIQIHTISTNEYMICKTPANSVRYCNCKIFEKYSADFAPEYVILNKI